MRGAKMASALVSSNRAEVLKSVVLACVLGTAFGVPTARAGDTCQPHWQVLAGPNGVGVNNWANVPLIYSQAVYDDGKGGGPALYAAGWMETAGGVTVSDVARWDGSAWSALAGPGGLIMFGSGSVTNLIAFNDGSGPALYASGFFSSIGGMTVNGIARWDGTTWSALSGPGGVGVGPAGTGDVRAFAVFDDGSGPALYVGGNFTSIAGYPATTIARWDGSTWSGPATGTNGTIWALTSFDDGAGPALYAGGSFITAGGVTVNNIAKWNGSSWSALAGPSGVGVGGNPQTVKSLTVFDDGSGPALYAGGGFATAGGVTVNRVAKWNGSSWSALAGPSGTGTGPSGFLNVEALSVFDDGSGSALYVGGQYTTAGGVVVNGIARWNGSAWSGLASPGGMGIAGTCCPTVFDLTPHDDGSGPALFVGGSFLTVGGLTANGAAKWQGCAVSPPPCLADINGDGTLDFFDVQLFLSLYAAGNFAADFTGDGTLDFFDVQAFLNLYAAGCP
ncbi:MAG: hypothetical protein KF757_08155 [Phycisphaeraceae bacterium]|nr:hypothetical protein [Phycisphaeraceae bacterium]MCW5762728.1 hypothetical protein [Phycisphaeraceae bacterium]